MQWLRVAEVLTTVILTFKPVVCNNPLHRNKGPAWHQSYYSLLTPDFSRYPFIDQPEWCAFLLFVRNARLSLHLELLHLFRPLRTTRTVNNSSSLSFTFVKFNTWLYWRCAILATIKLWNDLLSQIFYPELQKLKVRVNSFLFGRHS